MQGCDRASSDEKAAAPAPASGSMVIEGTTWLPCAREGATCALRGTARVMYGTASQHVVKEFTDEVVCDNTAFDDPSPGADKRCWYASPAVSPARPGARPASMAPVADADTRPSAPPAVPQLDCKAPGAPGPATESGDPIEADTPGSDGTRMFARGAPVRIAFTARPTAADALVWQIRDAWNTVRASGRFPVAARAGTYTLSCTTQTAGYFAISASFASKKIALMARGTRPAGIATFGVLPDVSAALPAVAYAHPDQHRFGGQGAAYLKPGESCCSGDGYRPLYPNLGLTWVNDNRNWYMTEPKGPNMFNAAADNLTPFFKPGDLLRLIQLDGIPGWASPTHERTHSYAPASLDQYRAYLRRVGEESNAVRKRYFPQQTNNYYQVTWEPDYEGGLPWRDSDANLVAMFKATHESIHATDPNAVVMGLTLSQLSTNTTWLKRLAPLGIGKYLDGVSAHGYYDIGTSPSHPPERFADSGDPAKTLPGAMRELRRTMTDVVKPGAKLFVTETGVSYDIGSKYGPNTPNANVLYAQGAVVARTHLILLGEGADVSFVFYSADPPEVGYGVFFDLVNAQGGFGQTQISPKPAAMSVAAMTRLIDGTTTLGAVNGTPKGVYAYAFQRLNGGKVVTALWTHRNAVWPGAGGFSSTYTANYSLTVDAPDKSGNVTVFDMMGNATTMPYRNGRVALALTESPVYVVSDNAQFMRSNVATPAGYVAQ
ncbi:hypothetical protein AWB67_02198 [Caballeronia terrestris]|uniref:Uncharacterized protein n=1 Tax=Caballeronia terrestris TaxID=1226301 RepID=A0A158HWC2_9BURK|nr:hypothetical protein [Caballeronia terrestris]SAL48596.1 hypothetical protein AWB67_02198 [Caballeronia terrestris]